MQSSLDQSRPQFWVHFAGLRNPHQKITTESLIFFRLRVLEEEIEVLEQEVERTRANLDNTSRLITTNETELHTEETRLNKTKRDLLAVREQLRVLETQQEPEPIDVLTFVGFHLLTF